MISITPFCAGKSNRKNCNFKKSIQKNYVLSLSFKFSLICFSETCSNDENLSKNSLLRLQLSLQMSTKDIA